MKVKTLQEIAAEHLGFPTLETKGTDSADFRQVAVWNLARALEQAYAQGYQAAERAARDAGKAAAS